MPDTAKTKKILQKSRQILLDVALPNGAIVAANSDHKYYPKKAKDYRLVWPRDGSYICIAADYLDAFSTKGGKLGIQESYFDWLNDCPEDFKKEGLLYQNYSTNGKKREHQFQPDQMGVSLWAIWHHYKNNLSKATKYEILIKRLADGICNEWKGAYFFKNTCDLWEEGGRKTSTKMENNFTYTLAACASGLEKALLIFPNNNIWKKTAKEMRKKIDAAYNKKEKYFHRNYGKISDINTDASLLGLVWPFEIIGATDERMKKTVERIENRIAQGGGVHRFEMDYYDGEGTAREGAGAWPLLNFWMAIYWNIAENNKKANAYFDWVIERTDKDLLIPEQMFDDFRDGQGIKPLAWSHAMFVIAYYKLFGK